MNAFDVPQWSAENFQLLRSALFGLKRNKFSADHCVFDFLVFLEFLCLNVSPNVPGNLENRAENRIFKSPNLKIQMELEPKYGNEMHQKTAKNRSKVNQKMYLGI